MIAGEARLTRCVMGRLERGEEVVAALAELARQERIDAGFVRAQGAVEAVSLARYDAAARRWLDAGGVPGAAELASLAGSVSLDAGRPAPRLWAVVAAAAAPGARGEVAAGLLVSARAVFVEFAIDVYDEGDLERREDAATGVTLWRPPRRR